MRRQVSWNDKVPRWKSHRYSLNSPCVAEVLQLIHVSVPIFAATNIQTQHTFLHGQDHFELCRFLLPPNIQTQITFLHGEDRFELYLFSLSLIYKPSSHFYTTKSALSYTYFTVTNIQTRLTLLHGEERFIL